MGSINILITKLSQMPYKIIYPLSVYLCLIVYFFSTQNTLSQTLKPTIPVLSNTSEQSEENLPPLEEGIDTSGEDLEKFAKNKAIPKELRSEILEALSYYPELENIQIDFIFCKNIKGSVMQAQPRVKTMWFRHKSRRGYKVKISRHLHLVNKKMKVETVPNNVLVGWIGHELGHIMDYRNRSNLAMLCFGVNYVCSKRFLRKAEQNADKYAISHGLSSHLIETKHFILDHAKFPKVYKEKIRELYMSPEDVMATADEIEEE